jgi:hypothetical protein
MLKLERIWKEAVVAYFRYYPGIFLEGKPPKLSRNSCNRARIRSSSVNHSTTTFGTEDKS